MDITEGPKALTRTMPPRVARFLDARDPWCGVPMCYNRVDLDRHHEGGWRKIGHDPDRCLRLCRKHHRQRHDGLLTIEGTYPNFVFKLSDGTVLEEPKPALVVAEKPAGASAGAGTDASRESPSGSSASPTSTGESGPTAGVSSEAGPGDSRDAGVASASCEAGAAASREAPMSRRVLDETAIAALQRLEMKPREAQRAVRRAREMLAEPPTDVQTLLAAALRYA